MINASLVLPLREDKVLLGEKIKKGADIGFGTINGPGGKQDNGETMAACAIRETGAEVKIYLHESMLTHRATITFFNGIETMWKVWVYVAIGFEGEPKRSKEMIPYWFPVTDLPLKRMLAGDRLWMPRAISGEPFDAHVFYEDGGGKVLRDHDPIIWLPYSGEAEPA